MIPREQIEEALSELILIVEEKQKEIGLTVTLYEELEKIKETLLRLKNE